jgi:hypothetical protein
VAERTPGGSKASKRAWRPLTSEPSVREKCDGTCGARECVEATGLAIAGNLRPRLMRPRAHFRVGLDGQRAGARGESGREDLSETALAVVDQRTRKEAGRPARAGTAPREGKALEGSSKDASGMKEDREASGARGERRGPKDLERATGDKPEPSRGARTLRTAPTGVWRPPSRGRDGNEAFDGEGHPT